MQTRRRFLQTLAAAPTVAAVPMLWAMDIPEPPEVSPFDAAEYNCGLIWVEADTSVWIHRSVYSWQEWDMFKKKLVRKEFVQLDLCLPGQCEYIVPDPKFCIPYTARNGRGALHITYSHGRKKSPITYSADWTFNDLNNVGENKSYHRRLVVA